MAEILSKEDYETGGGYLNNQQYLEALCATIDALAEAVRLWEMDSFETTWPLTHSELYENLRSKGWLGD